MAENRFINIDFPFRDSEDGSFFKLNKTDRDAVRADLLHLLLTNKGDRLYLPDFGSDLRKYIFQPNDDITHGEIRDSLNETIKKYIPNLIVDDITFVRDDNEEKITVILKYTVTEGTFSIQDTIQITF